MDTVELDQFIIKAREGDRNAFNDIIQQTAMVLRAYVLFYIDDQNAADDVVQNTYFYVYRNLRKYQLGTNFIAWMKAVARNHALAESRRQERKVSARKRYHTQLRRMIAAEALKQEEGLSVEEKLQALKKCVKQLSSRLRKIIQLKYVQSMKLSDIADALQIKSSAVGVALFRARTHLADCIKRSVENE